MQKNAKIPRVRNTTSCSRKNCFTVMKISVWNRYVSMKNTSRYDSCFTFCFLSCVLHRWYSSDCVFGIVSRNRFGFSSSSCFTTISSSQSSYSSSTLLPFAFRTASFFSRFSSLISVLIFETF